MTSVRALRHRQFRLWLVTSLQEWAEYCQLDQTIVGTSITKKFVYEHGWEILRDWATQDLDAYQSLQKTNSYV